MADDRDLTTVEDVIAFLGLKTPVDAETSALLQRLVTAASVFIQTHLGRDFAEATYIEARNGNGSGIMVLGAYPVTAVSAVTVDGVAIPSAVSATESGFVSSDLAVYLRGYIFTKGVRNVSITYTAGYATTPPDVAQVCIDLVARKYRERDRVGYVSKSIGPETITFVKSDFTGEMKSLLRQYQRVVPV